MDPAELEGWLMGTAERGISAKIHCTGDASVRLVLDTVQKVREAGHTDVRYHVAHGQFVHPEDVPRFRELGVVADISPALWFPGVIANAIKDVLGEERGSRLQPNRSLVDAGAIVAGGSDWPVSETPNAFEAIYGLVTRKDPTCQFPGALWPEQALTWRRRCTSTPRLRLRRWGWPRSLGRSRPASLRTLRSSPPTSGRWTWRRSLLCRRCRHGSPAGRSSTGTLRKGARP